jgi:hypothetical protein
MSLIPLKIAQDSSSAQPVLVGINHHFYHKITSVESPGGVGPEKQVGIPQASDKDENWKKRCIISSFHD